MSGYENPEFYQPEGGFVAGEDVVGDVLGAISALRALPGGQAIVNKVRQGLAREQFNAPPVRRALPAVPARPAWRERAALGVQEPGYGLWPVPLTPLTNNGIFTAAITNIQYRAIAQNPFRGERLVTDIRRTGAAGVQVFAQNGVFIGTRPQQGVLGPLPLESYSAQAFDMRLVMQQAEQGAELNMFCFVNPAPAGADTLALGIQILGRVAA